MAFAFCPTDYIFSEAVVVFDIDCYGYFGALQSRVHDYWTRSFSSSLKDDLRYTASDCYETFAFPESLVGSSSLIQRNADQCDDLKAIGERYHQFRADLMVANNEGLTRTYNRFHDPSETSPELHELRRLHSEMDQAMLQAYGWSDIDTACGFGLDYLDTEDDAQLPDDLQERIDSGELFFWEPDEASAFEAQLRAYGAVKGKKKLPWRYRWPDAVRDDVLARLLALNAERYAEEVAQGLHNKGARAAAVRSGASLQIGLL